MRHFLWPRQPNGNLNQITKTCAIPEMPEFGRAVIVVPPAFGGLKLNHHSAVASNLSLRRSLSPRLEAASP